MNYVRIHEWQDGAERGATIWFYKNGQAYASFEVSKQKAHSFWMRAFNKGIVSVK